MPQREAIKALVGVAAPLLTTGTVAQPGVDTDESLAQRVDATSPWAPRQWIQTPPFVMEHQEFAPNNPVRFGGQAIFEIPKTATLIEDAVLVLDLPPLIGGVGTTFLHYVDHLGYAIINRHRITYASNTNWSVTKWSLYRRYAMWSNDETRASINPLILGDATTAQRTAFAANGGRLYVELFEPFSDDTTLAYPLVTVSQKIRFEFDFEPLVNIIHTDSPTTVTTNGDLQAYLWLNMVHTTGTEANIFFSKSLRPQGVAYMVHEPVIQNADSFANNVNNVDLRVKITNITRPIQILYWWMIPDNLINNTGTNDYFMYNPNPPPPIPAGMSAYNPPTRWRIEANGLRIQDSIDIEFCRWHLHKKYHSSRGGEYIIFQTYTLNPEAINAALGYMDYGNLNNPTLFITMGIGGTGTYLGQPQSIRVMIEGLDYNFWFLQGGDFSKSFT